MASGSTIKKCLIYVAPVELTNRELRFDEEAPSSNDLENITILVGHYYCAIAVIDRDCII
jgi:hypothetical protein